MDGREKREELAARIKAGEKSLLPMLWGECRGTVIIMASKYRSIIEQNAFVDMEDLYNAAILQCWKQWRHTTQKKAINSLLT